MSTSTNLEVVVHVNDRAQVNISHKKEKKKKKNSSSWLSYIWQVMKLNRKIDLIKFRLECKLIVLAWSSTKTISSFIYLINSTSAMLARSYCNQVPRFWNVWLWVIFLWLCHWVKIINQKKNVTMNITSISFNTWWNKIFLSCPYLNKK